MPRCLYTHVHIYIYTRIHTIVCKFNMCALCVHFRLCVHLYLQLPVDKMKYLWEISLNFVSSMEAIRYIFVRVYVCIHI